MSYRSWRALVARAIGGQPAGQHAEHGMQPWAESLAKCSRCGLCLSACPTYAITGREADGPRGRLALVEAVWRKLLPVGYASPSFARCLLCGRCSRLCSAKIPLQEIFLAARSLLNVGAPWRLWGRVWGAHPRIADLLQMAIAPLGGIETLKRRLALPPLALAPQGAWADAPKKPDVLFFPGCLTRRFYPKLGEVCLEALGQCGHRPLHLPGLPCCGRPLALQGQRLTSLLRRWLAHAEPYPDARIVTSCPACLDTMRHIWPQVGGLRPAEREQLLALAARATDIFSLLADLKGWHGGGRVVWHRPCLATTEASASALALLGDYEVVVESEASGCCGAPLHCLPRTAMRTNPAPWSGKGKLEQQLPLRVQREALEHRAELLVTTCPGCMWQLQAVRLLGATPVAVRHPLELLLRRPEAGKIRR